VYKNEKRDTGNIIRTALQESKINLIGEAVSPEKSRGKTHTVLKDQITNVTIWWLTMPYCIQEVMGLIWASELTVVT
jgi:hypothetical protein